MIAPTTLAVAAIAQGREDERQRGGNPQLPEDGPPGGRIAPHQLECARVGGAQTADRVDRDREEREVGGDHRDGAPALQRRGQLRVHPDDDHRCDGEDRDRLARHDVGQEPARQEPRVHEHDPDRKADDRSEREPCGGFLGGEERLVPEDRDQRRLVDLCRLPEGFQDRPDVRHRRRVDDERPRPAGRRPDPAVELPEADEEEEQRDHGERPGERAADRRGDRVPADERPRSCDLRHAGFLSRSG